MIEAEAINYLVGNKKILSDVSLKIKSGELVAILGQNGAGKSSLLKILSGASLTHTGLVKIDEKLITDYSLQELAQKRAVLSQSAQVNFPFTVLEIVLMGRNSSVSGNDQEIARESLMMVDALHLAERIFPTLSGGEQQRVHIARVLAQIWQSEYAYLFLDEPTSALDLKHQYQLMKLLKKLGRENKSSSICVMHDLHLAAHYADRILFLLEGKIVAFDEAKKVLKKEIIAHVYDL